MKSRGREVHLMSCRRLLLVLLLLVPACSSHASKAGAPAGEVAVSGSAPETSAPTRPPESGGPSTSESHTAPAEAWAAIRSGALLVDVRTQSEYDQGHLQNALLIPHDQVAARASELGDDKSRAIVLYCRSGSRSSQAKKALEGLGFTNVTNAGAYESLKQAQ
jgi:phage shock protein E